MHRLAHPSEELRWLVSSAGDEDPAGFDLDEWADSTWVLHAMYEDTLLRGLGTHDEWHRRQLEVGAVEPVVIAGINVHDVTTDTGIPIGYVSRPGTDWERLTWHDYIERTGAIGRSCHVPPCFRWFPQGSWPVAIQPPAAGSLDEETLGSLLKALDLASTRGADTECIAYYAPLATGDYDTPHLWRGPLRSIPELLADVGGPYGSSPSNFWPVDRTWFVWTDWDLQGTKVSGSHDVVSAVRTHQGLETIEWSRP